MEHQKPSSEAHNLLYFPLFFVVFFSVLKMLAIQDQFERVELPNRDSRFLERTKGAS
jgi:hypothetical protein